ncbi:response regulator [Paenibacillus sp. MMS20-IR301]|uniref:response regulator transcription factor n=1 Tax=Paenibacillus sp. MMS20-IR301 TaxID=2895946 RepID=UPI0028ECC34D|nr:response regulator [Paenibacillus sp. MMS20-IR301]WNS41910.1 response regulator [Paenibacillus sp. MMS20-IR301]
MGTSILVADDEYNARMGVSFTLRQWGEELLRVDVAENGMQSLQLLRERSYDLLITDIRMPLLSGIEVLETLRKEQIEVPTILLTGFAEFEYAQQGLKLGAVDYLLKPVQQDLLIQSVERALKPAADKNRTGTGRELAPPKKSNNSYINLVIQYIHDHIGETLVIKDAARHVHLNASYLSVLFKEETGCNFIEFVTQLRIRKAKELLLESDLGLDSISERIGLQTTSYFIRVFKKYEEVTPKQFREQHKSRHSF